MNEPNGFNSTQQPPTAQRASTSHLQTETNNQAESKNKNQNKEHRKPTDAATVTSKNH